MCVWVWVQVYPSLVSLSLHLLSYKTAPLVNFELWKKGIEVLLK